jgi:hypothetical protein
LFRRATLGSIRGRAPPRPMSSAAGGSVVGWTTADVGDWTRTDVEAAPPAARRAFAWSGSAYFRGIFKTVATLTETGVAVLLVEQNVHAALALAKRAYVIEMGRIVLSGSDLLHDPRVRESYLGKVALG